MRRFGIFDFGFWIILGLSLATCPSSLLFSQQPQAQQGQPIYPVNAKYVNGVAPGYWPTAGSGLTLNISAGTASCGNPPTPVFYAGGALPMAASQTNYVYLDPVNSCAPTSNTTGFSLAEVPLALVVTSPSKLTSVTDLRPLGFKPSPCTADGGGNTICAPFGDLGAAATSQAVSVLPQSNAGDSSHFGFYYGPPTSAFNSYLTTNGYFNQQNVLASLNPNNASTLAVYTESNSASLWAPPLYSAAFSTNPSGTRPQFIGGEFEAYQLGAGATSLLIGSGGYTEIDAGSVAEAAALASNGVVAVGGAVANAYGLLIGSNSSSSGAISNNVGLQINDQTAGQNNWALKTGKGLVSFGDQVTAVALNGILFADQFPGTDACAKIQAAVSALPSTGGVVDARGLQGAQTCSANPFTGAKGPVELYLGPATYTISATWVVPVGSAISCLSPQATVLHWTSQVAGLNPAAGVYIGHCDLRGANSAGTGAGIDSGNSSNVIVDSNIIEQWPSQGINTGGNESGWKIVNNLIQNNLNEGIYIPATSVNVQVKGNIITGNGYNGVDCVAVGCLISNNVVSSNGTAGTQDVDGILVFAGSATLTGVVVSGNSVSSNRVDGVRLQTIAGGVIQGASVTGNIATGNGAGAGFGDGIHLDASSGGTITQVSVTGNTSFSNARNGVTLESNNGGAVIKATVIGNQAQDNSQYGVQIAGGSDNLVSNNQAIGNATGQILDSGTRTLVSGNKTNTIDQLFVVPNGASVGSLSVGAGSTLSAINYYSTANISPTAVSAQSCSDQTYSVTGLALGDKLGQVIPPGALGNLSVLGYVSATNTVLLHFCNPSTSSVTPPAGVYSVVDFR